MSCIEKRNANFFEFPNTIKEQVNYSIFTSAKSTTSLIECLCRGKILLCCIIIIPLTDNFGFCNLKKLVKCIYYNDFQIGIICFLIINNILCDFIPSLVVGNIFINDAVNTLYAVLFADIKKDIPIISDKFITNIIHKSSFTYATFSENTDIIIPNIIAYYAFLTKLSHIKLPP